MEKKEDVSVVSAVGGMKPPPKKADVIEAMAQLEYKRQQDALNAALQLKEDRKKAVRDAVQKAWGEIRQTAKMCDYRVAAYDHLNELEITVYVEIPKDVREADTLLESACNSIPEISTISEIRKQIRERLSFGAAFSGDSPVKTMVDTPAIASELRGVLDKLYGRDVKKQIAAKDGA